jgi:AmiR/NasT family two-component response regulator
MPEEKSSPERGSDLAKAIVEVVQSADSLFTKVADLKKQLEEIKNRLEKKDER